MLKVLVKKQLMEVFRTYFYDPKKNKKRSTPAVICWFIFFFALVFGMLGGIFMTVAKKLCPGLLGFDMGWMYFDLMAGIAIAMGAFGSVFNTFTGLYLGKDNDLLLSMPIPVNYIIISRLVNVYLLGTLYSAAAFFPSLIVYWMNTDMNAGGVQKVICGLLLFFIISLIVLILSCLLGLVVAKVSTKLNRKSFLTVLASLIFIGGYYFVYFKANAFLTNILTNALLYGEKIKNTAYGLVIFGNIGEGNIKSTLIVLLATAILLAVTMLVLSKTFFNISTVTNGSKKKKIKSIASKEKSVQKAVLLKEFSRFTSSPNYMLNCGFGVFMIPVAGVVLLIKGDTIISTLSQILGNKPDIIYVLFCSALCIMSTMNDSAAPSVSLEGKNLWIAQSLPVESKIILRSKMLVQIIISVVPVLFTTICAAIVIDAPVITKALLILVPLTFCVLSAAFNTLISIKFPNLSWTNELVPIKQSASVMVAILGGWAFAGVASLIYYFITDLVPAVPYLALMCLIFSIISAVIICWLETKGAKEFENLH